MKEKGRAGACFLLGGRGAGQRVRGSHPTCEDPHRLLPRLCRLQECPGSAGGCGRGLGSSPRGLDRGRLGHKPRPEGGGRASRVQPAAPPLLCLGRKQCNCGNLELGSPPRGQPCSSASTSCPRPLEPCSLIRTPARGPPELALLGDALAVAREALVSSVKEGACAYSGGVRERCVCGACPFAPLLVGLHCPLLRSSPDGLSSWPGGGATAPWLEGGGRKGWRVQSGHAVGRRRAVWAAALRSEWICSHGPHRGPWPVTAHPVGPCALPLCLWSAAFLP